MLRATATRYMTCFLAWICWMSLVVQVVHAFVPATHVARVTHCPLTASTSSRLWSSSTPDKPSGYVPQREESSLPTPKPLYPKVGDIVRYYDIDGGRADGEVLVGKISFLQKQLGSDNDWLVELTELENVGDGYYAEYSSRKKQFKKATRPLEAISPIAASFVRSESAYKIPRELGSQDIIVKAKQYTIEGFTGPFGDSTEIDLEAIQQDAELYGKLKSNLLRNAALAGVAGTLIADLIKGTEDAAIYAAGAAAGVGYLFFLALKTDTLGSQSAKLGSNVANFRFVLPFLVLMGVAAYNMTAGTGAATGIFSTVTPEQFAAAIIGFLTYRIPLFASQISPLISESGVLPGSAGVAMQLATAGEESAVATADKEGLVPVLLVSGPPGTGKTTLVKKLIEDSNGRFVEPEFVDRIKDGANYERLALREEFLQEKGGRYGLTKESILTAADREAEQAVVVDADVDLAKKLTRVSGARLIGVWVGLDSMEKFESRLNKEIDSGEIEVPPDETRESVIRAKVKEIVADIEYGVVSGVFEFTILNDDFDSSLEQLKFAAEYCFK